MTFRTLSKPLGRRDFQKRLAAAGLGLVTLAAPFRSGHAAPRDLQVFTWAGYDIPELHRGYIEKHGVSPSFTIFGGTEEAFQKVRAGFNPDVMHPCVEDIRRWHDTGMIKKIDTSRMVHWPDLWPELFNLPGAVIDGENWFVPIDWGNGSLLYRTDLVEPEEDSWRLAFDERYKGRIAMYNGEPSVTIAALVLGINPFDFSEQEGAKIKKLLIKQRELVRFYWDSPAEYQQAMASGEIVVAYAWNDGLKALREQGVPVKYMNPKEGILNWTCGAVHLANAAASDDLVYDFLNAYTAPETGKYFLEGYNYGHSNQKAFDLVPADLLENLGMASPSELFRTGVFETEVSAEMEQRRTKIFEGVRLGL